MKKSIFTDIKKIEDSSVYIAQLIKVIAGIFVLLLGLSVIFGWHTDNEILIRISNTFAPMVYNTAFCFVFCGATLLLMLKGFRLIPLIFSAIVLLFGALTVVEYLTSADFHLDQLLMSYYLDFPVPKPGRMPLSSAICFTLSGAAFLLINTRAGKKIGESSASGAASFLTAMLGALVGVMGTVALMGYFMNIPTAYSWGVFSIMAVHTAFGFVCLGLGILVNAWDGFKEKIKESTLLLPVMVCLGILTLTIGFYIALQSFQQINVIHAIDGQAAALKYAVENGVKERKLALERMAGRWTTRGGTPFEEWKSDAQSYNNNFQTFQAIEWVDPNFIVRWVEPLAGNESALNLNLAFEEKRRVALESALRQRQTIISQTVELKQGGRGILIYVPVYRSGEFDGFILGVSNANTLLQKLLPDELKNDYSIAILENGLDLYDDKVVSDLSDQKWNEHYAINLPGNEWQVNLVPRPATLDRLESNLPKAVLLAGILFSLLLAATVYFLQIALRENAESRRARNEIGKREELYRTLVRNIPKTAVVIFDRNFRYTLADGVQLKEHGFSQEMFEGKTLQEVFPPEISAEWLEKYSRALAGETLVEEGENNGRTTLTQVLPVRNDDNEVFSGMVMWRDVTESKRMEKALREVNIMQEAILNSANFTIISTTTDGIIKSFNRTAERWLGYAAEEVINQTTPAIIHDPQEIAARAAELTERLGVKIEPGFEVFSANAKQGLVDEHEWTYIRKDGSRFPVCLSITAIRDETGEITGYLGIGNDISAQKQADLELKQSERRYRSLIEKSPGFISTHDLNGKILSVNPAATHALGYEPEEVVGKTMSDFMPPDKRHFARDYFAQILRERETTVMMPLLNKDGEPRVWKCSNVLYDEPGERQYILGYAQDITDLKNAQRKVEESERRYRNLIEKSLGLICTHDLDGKLLSVNPASAYSLGYAPEELIGKSLLEIIAPERKGFFRYYLDAIRRDGAASGNMLVVTKSGAEKIWQFNNALYDGGDGNSYVLGYAQDITELKLTQDELQREREFLEAMMENISDGIVACDAQGKLTVFNRVTREIHGLPPNNKLDPEKWAEYYNLYYEDGVTPVSQTDIPLLRALKGENVNEMPLVVAPKNAEPRYILCSGRAIVGKDDKTLGAVVVMRDITESRRAEQALRESERKIRDLLEYSPVGIALTDAAGGVVFVNERWSKLTGLTLEQAQGEGWVNAVHPDDREKIVREWTEKSPVSEETTYEFRFMRKDGKVTEVFVRAIKQYDANGEFSGHLATLADISETKQLQEDLKIARDAALESARMKSEFLANMSHEIRTPMNGVLGMTDLLLDTSLDKFQRESAETIKTSAEALLTIINDILDFSKIEAGKLSFETIDFDLRSTVESTFELFSEMAAQKQIELASLVHSDVPTALQGDPGRLRQVLTNLIGNAVKFTSRGEVFACVKKESETDDAVRLNFSVKDTGIGINSDAQKYLFQAFTQADGSMTRKFGGTGLGLAISKQLIELMNGEISVESTPGESSIFTFTAEFKKQSENSVADPAEKVEPRRDLKNIRVLIVDDNATNRKILTYQTSSWGMIPTEAESGFDALETLRRAEQENNPFDLAILDLMMPGMDGFDLASRIRKDDVIGNIRLIIMPSFGHRGHGKSARETGIAGYLVKPVKQTDLFNCIATVMSETAQPVETEKVKSLFTRHTLDDNRAAENVRILVAEDNPVNQTVAKLQIERLGYQADVVENGLLAVEAVQKQQYSLVLMDCQMPEMDGYAATAEIRRNENGDYRLPIIAVTANAMQGEREKCLAAGMDEYLSKPFKQADLQATINRWITEQTKTNGDSVQIAEPFKKNSESAASD